MANEDGRIVVTYNGEIYNFRELRAELERAGHVFRSHADTEVLVHGYEEWGDAVVERLNGMFAFALLDRSRDRVLLARDRYGIKPLYTTRVGDTLLFGSEIKSFLEVPGFRVELSKPHLLEYFTFQNIFSDGTLFAGVTLLPPAHRLAVELRSGNVVRERYWDFDFREEETHASDEEYVEELDRLFRQAVERQLVSDVPVGAYLSGGMDSGSITAVAAARAPVAHDVHRRVRPDVGLGHRVRLRRARKAEAMSYLFKTEHYETVLKAGDMERALPRAHLASRRSARRPELPELLHLPARLQVREGRSLGERRGRALRRISVALLPGRRQRRLRPLRREVLPLLAPAAAEPLHARPVRAGRVERHPGPAYDRHLPAACYRTEPLHPSRPRSTSTHSLYLEAKTFLHGLLLVDDKLSMAHGLETRVPFLDNDLVDFAQRVPVRLKLRDLDARRRAQRERAGAEDDRSTSSARATGSSCYAARWNGTSPRTYSAQVKQGFSGPDASWFRGESIDYVRSVIDDPSARIYEFLQPAAVRSLVTEHIEQRQNRRLLLWSLLNFEHWCRTFLDGARP